MLFLRFYYNIIKYDFDFKYFIGCFKTGFNARAHEKTAFCANLISRAISKKRGNMKDYVVVGDVSCDLSIDEMKLFGVDDYITGHISIGDDRELVTKLEWTEISSREMFDLLKNKKVKVSTSPANVEEVYRFFEGYVKKGLGVLSISLSSKISATYSFTVAAAEKIKEAYPDAEIVCVDSMRMSRGFGYLVALAGLKKGEGLSLEENVEYLLKARTTIHQMGPIDDLFFVARRGNISMGKAIFGTFAGIRPMGDYSATGYTKILAKAKGAKKALAATVEYVKQTIVDPQNQYILIGHSDRSELAEQYKIAIEQAIPCKKVLLSEIFMGCSPNIGPGMISVNYLGNEIKEDMSKEEALLNDILKNL